MPWNHYVAQTRLKLTERKMRCIDILCKQNLFLIRKLGSDMDYFMDPKNDNNKVRATGNQQFVSKIIL